MDFILNVPYSEKDEAKKLDCKWNPKLKKWYYSFNDANSYANFTKNYSIFKKWYKDKKTNLIVFDHFYICELYKNCYKCGKTVKVFLLVADTYLNCETLKYSKSSFSIVYFVQSIGNDNLVSILKNKFNYFPSHTKTANITYYCNHCSACGSVAGDFYIVDGLLSKLGTNLSSADYLASLVDITRHNSYDSNQLNFKKSITYKIILTNPIEVCASSEFIPDIKDIEKFSKFETIYI